MSLTSATNLLSFLLEKQIVGLQETLAIIKYKRWYYLIAQHTGTSTIHDTLKDQNIPLNAKKQLEILHHFDS